MKAILTPQPPPVNEKFSLNLTYLLIIYAFPYIYIQPQPLPCSHIETLLRHAQELLPYLDGNLGCSSWRHRTAICLSVVISMENSAPILSKLK